jgi:tRNA(Ser,Leu) C12 N-acetylase TAN1
LATAYDREYREARSLLSRLGEVRGTSYRNVLVMKVDDAIAFLEAVQRALASDASIANAVARLIPVTRLFQFSSPEEFESKTREIVREWLPSLGGKKFHVRMHRRGFKGRLSSQHEEQFLDHFILEQSKAAGAPSAIDFDDPDLVIAIETLGQEAGLSLWTREQLRRYELLKID